MILFDISDDIVPSDQRLLPKTYDAIANSLRTRFPEVGGVIGVSYVSDDEIRRLNRVYRKRDAITDVLSFASDFSVQTGMLGDIVIAFDQAVRQSEGGDIELELTDLLVHGTLHILGYDHEDPSDAAIMFPLQDSLVASVL